MTHSRGFTLLEMVVSLALFSMMTLAIISAMRTFGNTQATLEEVTGRVDEARAVSGFLRDSIGAAMPVVRLGNFAADQRGGQYGTYFRGGAGELTWVAPLVAGANLGGAFVMHLARVEDRLELRWHPYLRETSAINWEEQPPRVLLNSVTAFEVGYLGAFRGEWLQEWMPGQNLPLAVRLNIKANERFWPELVVGLSGQSMNLR
ncbi:MAG: prepilin-type N-terminal cleavage/methylation domain-containing protein [Halioglobus sp.]